MHIAFKLRKKNDLLQFSGKNTSSDQLQLSGDSSVASKQTRKNSYIVQPHLLKNFLRSLRVIFVIIRRPKQYLL